MFWYKIQMSNQVKRQLKEVWVLKVIGAVVGAKVIKVSPLRLDHWSSALYGCFIDF